MDKIMSTRIDETVIQHIGILAKKLGTSKKAVLENAIRCYAVNHLGLWKIESKPPPQIPKSRPVQTERHIDYSARPGATGFPWSDINPALSRSEVFKDSDV